MNFHWHHTVTNHHQLCTSIIFYFTQRPRDFSDCLYWRGSSIWYLQNGSYKHPLDCLPITYLSTRCQSINSYQNAHYQLTISAWPDLDISWYQDHSNSWPVLPTAPSISTKRVTVNKECYNSFISKFKDLRIMKLITIRIDHRAVKWTKRKIFEFREKRVVNFYVDCNSFSGRVGVRSVVLLYALC